MKKSSKKATKKTASKPAAQQEAKGYALNLTGQELDLILNSLAAQPYNVVAPTMDKIQKQANAQR